MNVILSPEELIELRRALTERVRFLNTQIARANDSLLRVLADGRGTYPKDAAEKLKGRICQWELKLSNVRALQERFNEF